jgi:hypothetical protein
LAFQLKKLKPEDNEVKIFKMLGEITSNLEEIAIDPIVFKT